MGNKSRTLAEPADVQMNPQAVAAMDEAVNTMAALQDAYGHGRDLVNQLLGQAQMADAFEQFSRTVRTSKLAYVKENKLYQSLRGMKTPNGSVFSGTWEDFCGLLGVSSDKVDLDIANLRAFGEQALESMSRMGIGYRELRQYRRLDRDQQALLIEAAEAGDKGEFLDLAEELIARHAAEKAALASENEALKADAAATQAVLDGKNKRIDKLERERERLASAPYDEQLAEDLKALAERAHMALAIVRGDLRLGFAAIFEREAQGPDAPSHRHVMAGYLDELEREIAILRNDFHLAAVRA